jgi:hypothetical protein
MHKAFDESQTTTGCPICSQAALCGKDSDAGTWSFVCRTCGIFRITDEFLGALKKAAGKHGHLYYKLSYQFRLSSDDLTKPVDTGIHHVSELNQLLAIQDPSVENKLQSLLFLLGKMSSYPGEKVGFEYSMDYALISAKNEEEAVFFINALASQRFIDLDDYSFNAIGVTCQLTTLGWLELERLKQAGNDSADIFIAMWFHPDRSVYDNAITMAIEVAGYNPVRIDRVEHANRIDDEIITRIRRSKALIADFTGQRNGVYFEAGFMLGLGRQVIWACEHSELSKVHFDTRQYNTINYSSADELKQRLHFRIEALLGKGPLQK